MIDLNLLIELEGFRNVGYVPAGRKSGVTIGIGIDLGQQSIWKLRDAGVSRDLADILGVYIGLQGDVAREKLDECPLSLTKFQAMRLSKLIIEQDMGSLIDYFNEYSEVPFEYLHDRQQTVILSVTHQYGLHGAPKFMALACAGDWLGVQEELRDFGDIYDTRRNKEADYLEVIWS